MNYLTLENISKSYGEKILFKDVNLTIRQGQKIALVAKNGSGKSTLLRVIGGEEAPEGENARVIPNKGITTGFLKQDPEFNPNHTILEAALDSDSPKLQAIKKYEAALIKGDSDKIQECITALEDQDAWNMESNVKIVLGKLNLHNLDQKISTLSGGQKKRVALAKIIIDQPEFLILDEPTNHLDLDMIEWLEQHLQQSSTTLLMVTHDRYFLERVCNEIIELDAGNMYSYSGNYSAYLEKKAERVQNEAIVHEKTKKLFNKELEWIRRQPKARGTKAKSRVDEFENIKEKASQKLNNENPVFNIDTTRLGSKILEAHAISKSYGELQILDTFSYKFKKGEKVGIVGPNGIGKSTFIKILTQEVRADAGKVVIGDTVVFGHYTQDGIDPTQQKRVIDIVRDIAEYIPLKKGHKLSAEQLLERFLFPRPQQQVFISQLSGGELRRLHLLTILMKNPNFLILDEPTNDLDIITLNILEEYLMEFEGCVIIVSHDRYFMDKLIDHLFIMEGQGRVKDFNGTYTEYKNLLREQEYAKSESTGVAKTETSKIQTSADQGKKKLSYNEQKEFQKIEKEIEKLEKEKKEINAHFEHSDLSTERMNELSLKLGEVIAQLNEKEERWLELSEYI